jgi:hypothetical protein
MFNIKIAEKLGMIEAVLLHNIQFWVEKSKANNKHFYKDRFWTYNSAKAFAELFPYLSEQQISRALKRLTDEGWLLKDNFNNNPFDRTSWYSLSDKYYDEFMPENRDLNNETCINQNQNPDKSILINAEIKNDKTYICTDINADINKTDSKPDIEKKLKKSRPSIFSQALELYQPNEYFSLEDWKEWVEYKSARCKNLTLQTFKQNFNFLINLGSSAKASISQSINHNWQGLFEVKQSNSNSSQNNQGYFKGLSAKEQFSSVADGSYNPDDYDFSKLPIYS